MPAESPSDSSKSIVIPAHDRILRESKTLFANRGYEHTSTSSIARQAGTSESQLMKHFGSKAGLLEAIFIEGWTRIADEARREMQQATSPREKLQIITACALRNLERDPELKLLVLLEGRRIRKEGQMVALTDGFLGFVRLVDSVIAEMSAAHQLRADVRPQAVRSALMGMLEGMLRDRFLSERLGFPAEFQMDQLQLMFGLMLAAFSA